MGVPLGDGGNKKFNWASELSTYLPYKPIVVFGGGLFLFGIAEFHVCLNRSNDVLSPRFNGPTFLSVVACSRSDLLQSALP